MNELKAPMSGKVIEVKVNQGDAVIEGETVVIIEAMKMEVPVVANCSGKVRAVKCSVGEVFDDEAVLLVIE